MLAVFYVHLQILADHLLAPFATLCVIAGSGTIIGALVGNLEAVEQGLDDADGDAHVQARYNDGLVLGGFAALTPVAFLLIEALTSPAANR